MKIQQFSQQGKRGNNEDSLGRSAALLTVCDGMGGHVSGERASAFVKEAMLKAFAEPRPLGKMEIQQQLNQVQTDINQLLVKEPELEKMGTTFTGVFRTPDVWYAAHIGDSRIYLFRPSEQRLWHTWDHSLVGELMRTKEITIEAGRFHPMSNRISKAIIAQRDGKPASASIVKIDELKDGDVLMLCSDGVVEGWGDLELVKLFSDESLNFEQKCQRLAEQCNTKSKDNNTAIIAEIEEADAFSFGTNEELEWTTFAEVEADYNQYLKDNEETKEDSPKPDEKSASDEASSTVKAPKPLERLKEDPACVYGPPPISQSKRKTFLCILITLIIMIIAISILAPKGCRKTKGKPTPEMSMEQTEQQMPYQLQSTIQL
ncbi:MAG: serine/threonine-protein phosphatase [Bacteroidales bacterium]|nr:serine/threonine-protein phosphatase [Bacteroidales bacterium]